MKHARTVDPEFGVAWRGFSGFDWIGESPETVERAVSICAAVRADDIGSYVRALNGVESNPARRVDLARIAWHKVYARRTPCRIYFARVDNVVKIGRSTQVAARLETLNRQHGVEHDLLGTIDGDYREEAALHSRFRRHRVPAAGAREYFYYAPISEIVHHIIVAGHVLHAPSRRGRA